MRALVTLFGVVGCVVAVGGCGRPFTLTEGSGGASSSGSGASTGDGGAGAGGATGGAGAGGAAAQCKPGVIGACAAGSYCASGELACRPCADLSRLHFAAPFAIDPSPPTGGTTVFYPRTNADSGDLYFTYVDKSSAIPRRRLVASPHKVGELGWGTWSFLGQPIGSDGQESGPLYLHDASMLIPLVDASKVDTTQPVLLFDSNREGATTQRIFASNLDGSEAAWVMLPSGNRDTDLAAAPLAIPPRFYWLSDAGGLVQRLVTATASSPATDVTLVLDNGCATTAVDAPWVTPDGERMLFAAAYPAPPACATPASGAKHIFVAKMHDGAQVPGEEATALFPDDTTSYDATPALTADLCVLLFSRFDAAANGRIHGAVRD